jgi:catechol-2,3-dioxygenase
MDLEESSIEFEPETDRRPKMPEPPPVQLVAVADVTSVARAGAETQLDAFYAGMLGFKRVDDADGQIVYRAENFALRFNVVEVVVARDDFRPIGIIVPSLPALAQRLLDAGIESLRQSGLTPGMETLWFKDPSGNYVEAAEARRLL